ncbi:MAG: glycosyltransferase family 9 protein [Leptospirales bacterium]
MLKPGLQKFLQNNVKFQVLVVRNDGLGDLILTLPLVAALKKQAPHCIITMLVRKPFVDFTKVVLDVDDVICDEGVLLKRDFEKFSPEERKSKQSELIDIIRKRKFDIALMPYAESQSAKIIHKAGVKYRVGSLRRSFFYHFTNYFTFSRKKSNYSEYELNLKYMNILGMSEQYSPVYMNISPEKNKKLSQKKTIVIHPYKRNATSLAWPMQSYVKLVDELIGKGFQIIVMGDRVDGPEIQKYFLAKKGLTIDVDRDLIELGQLLLQCNLYIGNSSGPLHYAALLGKPHIGIFPAANSVSSVRWKTLPIDDQHRDRENYLLTPNVTCERSVCQPGSCGYENCLSEISVPSVLQAVSYWLE